MSSLGYFVREGVRRVVVARDAGWTHIDALIEVGGQPDQPARLPIDELYIGRAVVLRDSRYIRDVEYPTLIIGTPMPPIAGQPIRTAARLKYLTAARSARLQ